MNTVELVSGDRRHTSRVQRTYFLEWLEMRPVLMHCAKLAAHYCGLNHWKYKRGSTRFGLWQPRQWSYRFPK